MLRFTIRDLLWLIVVVALSLGWWHDHDRLSVTFASWNEQIIEAVKDTHRAMGHETDGEVVIRPGDYPILVPKGTPETNPSPNLIPQAGEHSVTDIRRSNLTQGHRGTEQTDSSFATSLLLASLCLRASV